jgi:hypothetical protein
MGHAVASHNFRVSMCPTKVPIRNTMPINEYLSGPSCGKYGCESHDAASANTKLTMPWFRIFGGTGRFRSLALVRRGQCAYL